MKIKFILIILLLAFLLFQADAQRGRSRSRSRSSFRKSGTKTESSALNWFYIIVGGIGYGGFTLYNMLKDRKKQVQQVMDQFENLNAGLVDLTEQDKQKSLDLFKQTSWRVSFKSKSSKRNDKWRMRVTSITKKKGIVYEFEAQGSKDSYGDSKIAGLLILKNGAMSICFDKLYADKNKSGQKGQYDVLVYEGHSSGEGFRGSWYFKGYKHDNKMSGDMSITPIKDNKKEVKAITDQWVKNKKRENQSTLTEDQKEDTIKKFYEYIWKSLSKNLQGSIFKMWEMKILKISKREESVYDFEGSGVEDQTETSQILGVIMFTQAGISFCFDKLYSKKKLLRQEGDEQLMIHEVSQDEKGYKGVWYFKGYQGDNINSGEIHMTSRQE